MQQSLWQPHFAECEGPCLKCPAARCFAPWAVQPRLRPRRLKSLPVTYCQSIASDLPAAAGITPFGRGLLSTQDIHVKQQLCSVPFDQLLLLPEKLGGSFDTVYSKFAKEHEYMPEELLRFVQGIARWDLRLTAWVLWLARYGSKFWQLYTSSLPKETDMTCLLNYRPSEQPELQWLAEEAAIQHSWAEDCHKSLFSSHEGHLKGLRLADSLQDTLWAMSLVRSRTFSDKVHDTELSLMVPHADLANHSFQPNAVYALRASQGIFELRSSTPVAQNTPICITYGTDKTNFELMRDYGFVVPGNPNDRLDFTATTLEQHHSVVSKPAGLLFKMLNGAPAAVSKEQQPSLLTGPFLKALGLTGKVAQGKLRPEGMSGQEAEAPCHQDAALSRKLAAVLSLPVLDSAEAGQTGGNSFWPPKAWTEAGEPALSTDLTRQQAVQQRQAVDQLQRRCQSMLAESGTSLETDEQLVQHQQLHGSVNAEHAQQAVTPRHAQAVHARLEHKRLIAAAESMLQVYSDGISGGVVLPRGFAQPK